jgi:ABC-type nitrate/sulfonate/bicarbonate transport system substrate-binding protein
MSKSITHPIFLAALALGLVTLGLGIAGDASAQTVTLRYGQAFSALRSIFALPLLVAEREKFFAREGLNFVVVPITGGPA